MCEKHRLDGVVHQLYCTGVPSASGRTRDGTVHPLSSGSARQFAKLSFVGCDCFLLVV